MKLLILFLFTLAIAGASARADENAVASCPIKTGVYRDGGSRFMNIPAHGKQPCIELILGRWKIDATTPHEYYLARDFFDKTGQPMKVKDVLRAFEQAESVLLSKYGIEFIYDVAMNPLILGVNVTEDEYVRKLSDSKFMERMDVSGVLGWIQQYRLEHRTEQAGADQSATTPESKPEGKAKPQPESKAAPQ